MLRDAFITEAKVEHWGDTIAVTGIKSASELEPYWPGFTQLWPQIKAACGVDGRKEAGYSGWNVRRPNSVYFSEKPERFYANDYDSGQRVAVDLENNRVVGSQYVSTGDAVLSNLRSDGSDIGGEVRDVPKNVAMLDCKWSSFYRTFSIRAQFPPGTLTKFLPAAGQQKQEPKPMPAPFQPKQAAPAPAAPSAPAAPRQAPKRAPEPGTPEWDDYLDRLMKGDE